MLFLNVQANNTGGGGSRVASDGGARQTRQGAQRDANTARGNSAARGALGALRDVPGRRRNSGRRGAQRG